MRCIEGQVLGLQKAYIYCSKAHQEASRHGWVSRCRRLRVLFPPRLVACLAYCGMSAIASENKGPATFTSRHYTHQEASRHGRVAGRLHINASNTGSDPLCHARQEPGTSGGQQHFMRKASTHTSMHCSSCSTRSVLAACSEAHQEAARHGRVAWCHGICMALESNSAIDSPCILGRRKWIVGSVTLGIAKLTRKRRGMGG